MSFNIGKLQVKISFFFTLVLALIILFDTGFVLESFLAVCAHEGAHLLCMLVCGASAQAVRFEAFGILIERGEDALSFGKNIMIMLSGCAWNLVLFCALFCVYLRDGSQVLSRFALINLALFFINILPVTGLDGGAVLSAVLTRKYGEENGLNKANIASIMTCAFVFVSGMILSFKVRFNLSLCAFSLYLFFCTLTKTRLND